MAMGWREKNEARWVGMRPAHKGVQICKSATAVNTTVVLHTVTAGKVLYLVEASVTDNSGAGVFELYIRDAADAFVRHLAKIYTPTAVGGVNADHWSVFPPLEIPAGYDLCVFAGSGAGVSGSGNMFGWEE